MLTLKNLLKNMNFNNYRRKEEPIKTLWQADKDFINSYPVIGGYIRQNFYEYSYSRVIKW